MDMCACRHALRDEDYKGVVCPFLDRPCYTGKFQSLMFFSSIGIEALSLPIAFILVKTCLISHVSRQSHFGDPPLSALLGNPMLSFQVKELSRRSVSFDIPYRHIFDLGLVTISQRHGFLLVLHSLSNALQLLSTSYNTLSDCILALAWCMLCFFVSLLVGRFCH